MEPIKGWADLCKRVASMGEEELRALINFEVVTYKRRIIIERLHSRFSRLRTARERKELVEGRTML